MERESAHISGLETYVVLQYSNSDVAADKLAERMNRSWHWLMHAKYLTNAGIEAVGVSLIGAAAICEGSAIVALAAPPTLVVLAAVAAAAASLEFGLSVGEVINEYWLHQSNAFVEAKWYAVFDDLLEILQLLDLIQLGSKIREIMALREAGGSLASLFSKGGIALGRAERKQLSKELEMILNDIDRNREFKSLVRAGKLKSLLPVRKITSELQMSVLGLANATMDVADSARKGVVRQSFNLCTLYVAQEGSRGPGSSGDDKK